MTRYCNRCNEPKQSNVSCPKCGCSEFRIIVENKNANQKGL
jgi:Zn finger protein HypA/HybF involved in hydrogenase expression